MTMRALSGRLLALLFAGLVALPAFAVEPDEKLADPAAEARARTLSEELRCLVCQNQSIDESDAALARDLRILLRERIAAGDSDEAVRDFLVDRYGEFILLKPRLSAHTVLLWATPIGALLLGAAIAFGVMRRRGAPAATAPLSEAERAALARLEAADAPAEPPTRAR
ncbi:cytochrome c-type biogenesis protein [Prosthecomicrobium pneumaticum]